MDPEVKNGLELVRFGGAEDLQVLIFTLMCVCFNNYLRKKMLCGGSTLNQYCILRIQYGDQIS